MITRPSFDILTQLFYIFNCVTKVGPIIQYCNLQYVIFNSIQFK